MFCFSRKIIAFYIYNTHPSRSSFSGSKYVALMIYFNKSKGKMKYQLRKYTIFQQLINFKKCKFSLFYYLRGYVCLTRKIPMSNFIEISKHYFSWAIWSKCLQGMTMQKSWLQYCLKFCFWQIFTVVEHLASRLISTGIETLYLSATNRAEQETNAWAFCICGVRSASTRIYYASNILMKEFI